MRLLNPSLSAWKKLALPLIAAFSFPVVATAQTPPATAAEYLFNTASGAYVPLTGGTILTALHVDDAQVQNIPIGFTFPFTTGTYTTVTANSNGWLALGNKNPTAAQGRTNSTANATIIGPMMMPLWDDQHGSPGQASYLTTGVAPNRVFTFEWRNWKWFWTGGSTDVISYQVRLYEAGRIEFIYQEGQFPVNSGVGATIGIAQSGTDYQTLDLPTATPISSSTSFVTNISSRPATGQIYIWDVPAPNNASVSAIPEPAVDVCVGNHLVKAQVKNVGGNVINNVIVNWSVDGVLQTPVSYTTAIPQSGVSAPITLGVANFPASVTTHNIKVWTSMPNGVMDTNPDNDSITISRKALDLPNAVVYFNSTRICPGDSLLLTAGTGPNYTYQWQFNADPIAGETNGTLYAKQDGYYSVKVFNPGCNLQSAFHHIAVKPLHVELGPDIIGCEKTPPITLDAGEPGSRYTWSTGDTTQTVTANDGTNTYWVEVKLGTMCVASDTVNLILEPLPEVHGISYYTSGNTYYFSPAGVLYANSYQWDFGDGSTDTAMYTSHAFTLPPPHKVTLKVFNSCGETSTTLTTPVSVGELSFPGTISIYPNPAQSSLTVETADKGRINHVKVFNTLGAIVLNHGTPNETKTTVDVSHLANGTYTLVVTTSSGVVNKTFQVSK